MKCLLNKANVGWFGVGAAAFCASADVSFPAVGAVEASTADFRNERLEMFMGWWAESLAGALNFKMENGG